LPGSAALNDSPVTINYLKVVPGGIKTVQRVEDDGFIVRTICEHCNRHTGGTYGTAFKEFALQFAASGLFSTSDNRRAFISLDNIQLLRVLKQMAGMVLAVQSEPPNESLAPLQRFVRQQRSALPERAGAFYLYRNISEHGRIASMTSVQHLFLNIRQILIFTEITWPPLGLVYALLGPHPLLGKMTDVTEWGSRGFRERTSPRFSVPQFRVEVNSPLAFGTPAEHEAWENYAGRVQLLFGETAGETPTQISSLIRLNRKRPR
jgi:hypothetical protein